MTRINLCGPVDVDVLQVGGIAARSFPPPPPSNLAWQGYPGNHFNHPFLGCNLIDPNQSSSRTKNHRNPFDQTTPLPPWPWPWPTASQGILPSSPTPKLKSFRDCPPSTWQDSGFSRVRARFRGHPTSLQRTTMGNEGGRQGTRWRLRWWNVEWRGDSNISKGFAWDSVYCPNFHFSLGLLS